MDDKDRLLTDARANLVWGKDVKEIRQNLENSGQFTHSEINEFIAEVQAEERASVRQEGLGNFFKGIPLLLLPGIFYLICWYVIGVLPVKIFAITCLVGIYGLYKIVDGVFKILTAKGDPAAAI